MSKKSIFISMMALFITLAWILEASALTCSRCRRSPWGLCLEEVLKGLGNVNKNVTFSLIDIRPKQLRIDSWLNPGGNDGGIGNPFNFSTPQGGISVGEQVTDEVVKNGKAFVDQYIPGCYIWDFIWCADQLSVPVCILWDENDLSNCLIEAGVCVTEYDYSSIPDEGFPANGNTNWSPEPPSCDPNIYPLGSLDNDGDLTITRLWVESLKTVYDCPKEAEYPDPQCLPNSTTVDEACLVLNEDNVSYDRVAAFSESECATYDQ